MTLVANQYVKAPRSRYIKSMRVEHGFDVADNEIVRRVEPGDLVITSDIPLAAEVIEKGGQALSFRGELFTLDNIRASGVDTGGQAAMSQTERQTFANHLDRILTHSQPSV